MKNVARYAAATAVMAAGLGLAGLSVATEAQAEPGPFPQWCPGDFWDPGWGDNWDWGDCHDNWGDLGLTPILTRIGGRDGGPAGQVDLVHPVTTAGQVDLTITNTTVSAGDGHGGPGGSRTLRTRTV
jgi:hypothetical protein